MSLNPNYHAINLNTPSAEEYIITPTSQSQRMLKLATISVLGFFKHIHSKTKKSQLLMPGEVLKDRYSVVQAIGKGSFGVVIEANDL